jgi:hypothetical protein
MLISIGRFFMATPLGLGLLLGLSAMYMLGKDQNPEETNKGIQNAGKADGGMAETIMEQSRDYESLSEEEKKLEGTRREQLKSALSNAPFLTKYYKKDVGKYLKGKGYSDEQIYELTTPVQDRKQTTIPAPEPEKSTSSSPVGTPTTAEPVTSTPASPSGSPAASVPAESSLSKGESVVSPSAMSAQISSPNVTQKLDIVNNENLDMKLPQTPSDRGMMITNNEKTQSKKGSTKVALPSVRNAEETFQRMILNSTRVV